MHFRDEVEIDKFILKKLFVFEYSMITKIVIYTRALLLTKSYI
ncbi:hypothetical protein FORMB_20110 [Formosa sp. Hel1_33_131]|nr:hypothetical protein FORMB_20110 [Formosa sp. Hel1_33_131]